MVNPLRAPYPLDARPLRATHRVVAISSGRIERNPARLAPEDIAW